MRIHNLAKRLQPFLFAALMLTSLSAFSQPQQRKQCGNESLVGAFGFYVTGINAGPSYYSLVGRFEADGRGNVTGHAVESLNGNISRPHFTATYNIDGDCTGQANLSFDDGNTAVLQFVIDDDGKSVEIMVAAQNGPGGQNETGRATKQFTRPPVRP